MPLVCSEDHVVVKAAVPIRGPRGNRVRERDSDCWPDFSSELSEDRLKASARKNRIGTVLVEILGAVAYSVGLVILLMIIANLVGRA